MRSYFEIFFGVNVLHRYYRPEDDFRCKALSFEPTNGTLDKLKGNGLYYKDTQNGFMIVAHKNLTGGTEAAPVLTPAIPLEPGTFFNFFIYANRPDFLNITDADLTQYTNNRKFFFRNEAADPMVTTPGVGHPPNMNNPWLTATSQVSEISVHNLTTLTRSLRIANNYFDAPVKISDDPVSLRLRDAAGNIVAEKIVPRSVQNKILADRLRLDPSGLEENIYKLQQMDGTGAVISEENYFLTPQSGKSDIVGIYQIDYSALLDGTGSDVFQFEVDLDTRSVLWNYVVQVEASAVSPYIPNQIHLNTPGDTVASLGGITFSRSVTVGTPSIVKFDSSPVLIPLQEMPYPDVNLIYTPLPDPIIPNLPNPNPMRLTDAGGGGFKAEIYLKIK